MTVFSLSTKLTFDFPKGARNILKIHLDDSCILPTKEINLRLETGIGLRTLLRNGHVKLLNSRSNQQQRYRKQIV